VTVFSATSSRVGVNILETISLLKMGFEAVPAQEINGIETLLVDAQLRKLTMYLEQMP